MGYFLGKLFQDYDGVKNFFNPGAVGPGSWPGPRGCVHYMMGVYGKIEVALDWLHYAYDCDSQPSDLMHMYPKSKSPREYLAEIEPLVKVAYEHLEAKPVIISLSGGYGSFCDGCFHYCSVQCALLAWDPQQELTPEQKVEWELSSALFY